MNIVLIDNDVSFCDSLTKYLESSNNMKVLKTFDSNTKAFDFLETKDEKIDLVMFNLNANHMYIQNLIEHVPKNCNLIALSEDNSMLQKYINFPYFQRIFEKPVPFSTIFSYLTLHYLPENFENFKNFVLHSMSELGFNTKHSGTTYLVDGIIVARQNKIKKLTDIYSFLACNYQTTPKIIKWSVNNAINHALKHDKEKKLQNFFKIYNNKKLTAKYIINYFVNYDSSLIM